MGNETYTSCVTVDGNTPTAYPPTQYIFLQATETCDWQYIILSSWVYRLFDRKNDPQHTVCGTRHQEADDKAGANK
jgi:hypothetical protein